MIGDLQGPRPDELVQVTAQRGLCDTVTHWPGCQVIL